MTDKNKYLFVPILAIVGVIYSVLFPVNQMSIENGLPYIGYVFWFYLLATLMLFIVSIYKKEFPRFAWPHIRAYLLLGTVAVTVPVPLFTFLADKLGRHCYASPRAGAASHLCNIGGFLIIKKAVLHASITAPNTSSRNETRSMRGAAASIKL